MTGGGGGLVEMTGGGSVKGQERRLKKQVESENRHDFPTRFIVLHTNGMQIYLLIKALRADSTS